MTNQSNQSTVGPLLKGLRLAKKITLREFADKNGLDAGNYSRVERGVFAPPSRDKLELLLQSLEVDQATQDRILDTAELERGYLPSDLLNDQVLLRELPVLFRAVRSGDAEALDRFIESVRNSPSMDDANASKKSVQAPKGDSQ